MRHIGHVSTELSIMNSSCTSLLLILFALSLTLSFLSTIRNLQRKGELKNKRNFFPFFKKKKMSRQQQNSIYGKKLQTIEKGRPETTTTRNEKKTEDGREEGHQFPQQQEIKTFMSHFLSDGHTSGTHAAQEKNRDGDWFSPSLPSETTKCKSL